MSLILGLHLSKKLYLISDTRATTVDYNGEIVDHEDNLIKSMALSYYVGVTAAGSANAASYILLRLKEKIPSHATIDQVMEVVNLNLKNTISEYVNKTGRDNSTVGLIVGGFNPDKKKVFEASRFGKILSEPAVPFQGEMINQRVDLNILKPLAQKLLAGESVEKGYTFEADIESSKMYSILLNTKDASFEITEVGCFDMVSFEPSKDFEKIAIPDDTISRLEFPRVGEEIGAGSKELEEFLYAESQYVLSYVQSHIESRKFETVGGFLFTVCILPINSTGYITFPAGTQAYIDRTTMQIKMVGNLEIIGGKFTYKDKTGVRKEFKLLEQYIFIDGKEEESQLYI